MVAVFKSEGEATMRRLMPILFVGVFMAALDTAVIGPAIPALRVAFGIDNRAAGLVMSVFVLCSLCSTGLMANLSDRYGRRPIYLSSIACFALGSLLVAVSPRFWMIVLSRAIQGAGAGGITPTASAVVGDVFPPDQRGRALGLIGATYGMAFVLGPPLAALIMLALSWHWIFLVNLPIAAFVLYRGAHLLPDQARRATQAPLDLAGIILTFLLLGALVLGITRIADGFIGLVLWPWFLAAAAVLLLALIYFEQAAEQPMIPLSLFANRQLAISYALAVGSGFGMGSVIFLPSMAILNYGVTPEHSGFALLPLVICSMLASIAAGRLLNRVGARGLILLGFALLAVGYEAAAVMGVGLWAFLAASMPIGGGIGALVGGSLRSIAIEESPLEVRTAAQGLINIFTAIGTLLAAAAISAVADIYGGGTAGFGVAYRGVAALMSILLIVTLGLGKDRAALRQIAAR
jgi:MFS family permease